MPKAGFKICDQSRVQPRTPDSLWPGESVLLVAVISALIGKVGL
jgi:hypothetical protein